MPAQRRRPADIRPAPIKFRRYSPETTLCHNPKQRNLDMGGANRLGNTDE